MRRDSELHPCPDFLDDFSAFVDGGLPAARRAEIVAHLDCCEGCLRHLSVYRRGVEAYRAARTEVIPGEVYVRIADRVSGGAARRPRPAGGGPPEAGWTRHPATAVAAAAVFAVAVFWAGTWSTRSWPGGPEPGSERAVVVVESPSLEAGEGGAAVANDASVAGRTARVPARRPMSEPGPSRSPAAGAEETPVVLAGVAVPTDEMEGAAGWGVAGGPTAVGRALETIEARIRDEGWARPARTPEGWVEPLGLRSGRSVGIRPVGFAPAERPAVEVWPADAAIIVP